MRKNPVFPFPPLPTPPTHHPPPTGEREKGKEKLDVAARTLTLNNNTYTVRTKSIMKSPIIIFFKTN